MSEADWSNDELRAFFSALRAGGLFDRGAAVDDEWRAAFRRQATRRVVPAVERRLLAEVGAMLDAPGIAHVALEVAEDAAWGAEHAWLMLTADPWRHLADLVRREIRRSYRNGPHPERRRGARRHRGRQFSSRAGCRRGVTVA